MTDKEIEFCKYWEEVVIPNKNNVHSSMLEHCGNILGEKFNFSCNSCIHNVAIDLKNFYYRLLPHYEEYKRNIESPYPITKFKKK